MFYQIFKGFIDLGAKLDRLFRFEHTPPGNVQRELAKSID
jgi:hypothetical protein